MKKTLNIPLFFVFGLFVEVFFLALLHSSKNIKVPIDLAIVSFLLTGFLFVIYRLLLDWRYFNNSLQKELKKAVISEQVWDKLVFSLIGAVFLVLGNLYLLPLVDSKTVLWLGAGATLLAWLAFEVSRTITNHALNLNPNEVKNNELDENSNELGSVKRVNADSSVIR